MKYHLTHWGRVTHICIIKLTIIDSDNGLSPGRRQAIVWINDRISIIGPLEANFSEIGIGIQAIYHKKRRLKMSSAKWQPFCISLNELKVSLRWHRGTAEWKKKLTSPSQVQAMKHFGKLLEKSWGCRCNYASFRRNIPDEYGLIK